MTRLPPVHPGEVLREEFIKPLGLSAGAVARAIGVPCTRIERLTAETVDLTPDTALRLARLFGTSAQFWLNIQSRHALETATDRLGDEIERIEPLTLVPVYKMLTTQQAADILNVSWPFLVLLLEKGEIEFSLVGRHRRIKAEHLFAYKKAREKRRAAALSDLAAFDAELL